MTYVRQPHDCPYCWRVLYSKGAQTAHINSEHWKELEADVRDVELEVVDELA